MNILVAASGTNLIEADHVILYGIIFNIINEIKLNFYCYCLIIVIIIRTITKNDTRKSKRHRDSSNWTGSPARPSSKCCCYQVLIL